MDAGFYGKLPSHGDFVRRRTSDAFVAAWDHWLQQCIAGSRAVLGEQWLDLFLTSPAWRFVCAPGACGPAGVAGVMAPSVDRVGRYFPLTIVSELPASAALISVACQASRFFDEAEQLIVDTLANEEVHLAAFDAQVAALGHTLAAALPVQRTIVDPAAASMMATDALAWHISLGASGQFAGVVEQLMFQQLSPMYQPLTLWCSEGSAKVQPTSLVLRGLPDPSMFAALLDGSWARHGWPSLPTRIEGDIVVEPLAEGPPLQFRSAAATDVGNARHNNEDSFMERTEAGLWAVADGLGGHNDGEIASRMTCDALMDFDANAGFDETIEAVRHRLQQVNDHLVHAAEQSLAGAASGSTVVVLLVRGSRAAVLWAGDSRVYRLRESRLEQLSQDHSIQGAAGIGGPQQSNIVTRAIGVESTLALDLFRDRILPGDRFLLCSDGLTRVVSEETIAAILGSDDLRAAADGLIQATIAAGAPDNVTVLIVDAGLWTPLTGHKTL